MDTSWLLWISEWCSGVCGSSARLWSIIILLVILLIQLHLVYTNIRLGTYLIALRKEAYALILRDGEVVSWAEFDKKHSEKRP